MSDSTCPDCSASPGKPHDPGCDVERCSICGHQALMCHTLQPDHADAHDMNDPRVIWSGEWPEGKPWGPGPRLPADWLKS